MTTRRSAGPWVVLAALILCATIAGPTYADVGPMLIAYQQDFENGNDGWMLDPLARGDEIEIVPDPMMDAGRAENHVLCGISRSPIERHGFRAESPTFDAMGVDTTRPYQINMRYGLLTEPACWTYALASKHVSIVLVECNHLAGWGRLAFVDEVAGIEESLGRIDLGVWNDLQILIEPRYAHPTRVTIRINGRLIGTFDRLTESLYDRLVFMDLPYRYVDATEEHTMPSPTAFGTGVWDDVVVRYESDGGGPGPRDVKPRVEPNPFNPRTVISFDLDREASVRVDLFDVSGRRVRSLFDGRLLAGPQALPWDGRDDAQANVASGVYLVRSVVDGVTTVTRATVVR